MASTAIEQVCDTAEKEIREKISKDNFMTWRFSPGYMKNPILILFYFTTLIITSWQLTLFTIVVLPGMGWLMGKVGKKLKRQSLEAQGKWSDTMSQLEETLGGLRIIKAFIAEDKMVDPEFS